MPEMKSPLCFGRRAFLRARWILFALLKVKRTCLPPRYARMIAAVHSSGKFFFTKRGIGVKMAVKSEASHESVVSSRPSADPVDGIGTAVIARATVRCRSAGPIAIAVPGTCAASPSRPTEIARRNLQPNSVQPGPAGQQWQWHLYDPHRLAPGGARHGRFGL